MVVIMSYLEWRVAWVAVERRVTSLLFYQSKVVTVLNVFKGISVEAEVLKD
jgi:hypothetical protein